jgi:hypothetical protein
MEENVKLVETLLERGTDYGKASYALFRLKTLDKASIVISNLLPNVVVLLLVATILLFLSLGLAYWLGHLMGGIHWGFFAVATLYAALGSIFRVFLFERLKAQIRDFMIQIMFN